MTKNKLKSGYIELLDKTYVFTYDGELLQLVLVPQDKNYINFFDCLEPKNKNFEVLEGITVNFERIFFLNCNLKGSKSNLIAKPSGYVCFNNGDREFDTIAFKSGIIDLFYHPNQIVDMRNTKYNYDLGGGELKLRTFDEISKKCEVEVDGKKAVLTVGVDLPSVPFYMQTDYSLGKPKSIFRLTFDKKIDVSEFRKIYMWVFNLMSFLNFRKDISLGEIEFGKLNNEKKIEKIGYTYLNEQAKGDISDVNKIIDYYFVNEHLNELLQILNRESLNLLFIPDSIKDDKYISAEKYMICCTSFESVFNYVFPNAKAENNVKSCEVKQDILQYINDKREEYKGKDRKKREELKKYKGIIELLDFSLEEKFRFCYDKYDKCLDSYKNRFLHNFKITTDQLENIPKEFAKNRNTLIHSSLVEFNDIHIFAYLLARVYIYIMILEKANIDQNIITEAIDKVF